MGFIMSMPGTDDVTRKLDDKFYYRRSGVIKPGEIKLFKDNVKMRKLADDLNIFPEDSDHKKEWKKWLNWLDGFSAQCDEIRKAAYDAFVTPGQKRLMFRWRPLEGATSSTPPVVTINNSATETWIIVQSVAASQISVAKTSKKKS